MKGRNLARRVGLYFKADFTGFVYNVMDLNNDSYLQPFEVMLSLRIKDVFNFIAQGEKQINLTNMTSNITYTIDSLQKEFNKNHTWILNDFDYRFLHYVSNTVLINR